MEKIIEIKEIPATIQKITKYKAFDGEVFVNKEDCERYEFVINLQNSSFNKSRVTYSFDYDYEVNQLKDFNKDLKAFYILEDYAVDFYFIQDEKDYMDLINFRLISELNVDNLIQKNQNNVFEKIKNNPNNIIEEFTKPAWFAFIYYEDVVTHFKTIMFCPIETFFNFFQTSFSCWENEILNQLIQKETELKLNG